MSTSLGILSTFDHQSNDWSTFQSRMEQWFIANDINDITDKAKIKRRAIILSALSESTYKLANNLALPKRIEEVDYDQILVLLSNHCTPKQFGFSQKALFYSAVQQAGETPTDWAARVRGLATHCGFRSLEEALVDRFVMGMLPGHERDKLFIQDQRELSLAKAVDMAESVRCARQAAMMGVAGADAAAVFPAKEEVFVISKVKCSVCGYTNHKANQCRFRNYKCKKCNRKGHLQKMCRSNSSNVNCVQEVDADDDGECVYNICCDRAKPMTTSVCVGGVFLEFQIDSGSAVSLICNETYNQYFSNVPLSPTSKKLFSYTGNLIFTKGVLRISVAYKGQNQFMDFFVVSNNGVSLLGRDFIYLFDLQLASINSLCVKDDSVIKDLISEFPTVFSGRLGKFNKYNIELHLKENSKPIFFRARPVPFALREKIDKELDRLIQLGILKPTQHSEYASPIVPVLKKDGGLRLCADYSVTLNKQLIVDKYPLPTINELFSKLNGGVQFSKIDLSMAYNQFQLSESSQTLTTINTHRGLYKFTRLVFGLSSAPAIFQRAIECVFSGLEGVVCFLDDVLITGINQSQHKQRLRAVLRRLQEAGLTVQGNKCEFFKDDIGYLGHIINKDGIRKSPDKVTAVLNASKPSNVTQLQSFLGLTNYYRNFLPDASSILSPLYNLLHKNVKYEWKKEHDVAFNKIKQIMASDSVLAHFDSDAKLILTVDASPTGLGAVLSQISHDGLERPVSYASRVLSTAERKYAQIQREATAIVFGIRRFHQYLYGRSIPFVLRTDHKPLLTIFGPQRGIPQVSANRLQRYAIFLSAYNYEIEYIRSKDNCADFFSRSFSSSNETRSLETSTSHTARGRGEEGSEDESAAYVNFVLQGDLPVTLKQLRRETDCDSVLTKVKNYVVNGWPRKEIDLKLKPFHSCRTQLAVENDCVMRGHRVVVPENLRERMCQELHKSHFGVVKMKAEARKYFWFPGIDARLEAIAGACDVCAALRPAPPRAPLSPWPYPPQSFYRIHLDFLGPLNNKMFLVIVDAYSKWVECYTLTSSYGSKTVIARLCDFMSRFGTPNTIVSDNGTSFTSQEFRNFCSLNGINHMFSPAYHPSSNGQAESMVKVIKKGIKSIIIGSTNKTLLQEQISKFLFDYRNSKNSTTQLSPAEIVFGRPLRSRLDLLKPSPPSSTTTDLTHTVQHNQCLQAIQYKGRERIELKVNDRVWVIKNYCNKKIEWIEAVVKKRLGKVLYTVFIPSLHLEVTRHINQIRPRAVAEGKEQGNLEGFTKIHDWEVDDIPDIERTEEQVVGVDGTASEGSGPCISPRRGDHEMVQNDCFSTPEAVPIVARRREITPVFGDTYE